MGPGPATRPARTHVRQIALIGRTVRRLVAADRANVALWLGCGPE